MQRLGKNKGGYFGDSIDIQAVLRDALRAAQVSGWQLDWIPISPGFNLSACRRSVPAPRFRLYISAGIHGDEPAGPLALRQLLQENRWRGDLDIWICPCLNPTGFPLNRRENAQGKDLNRDYRHLETEEVRAHIGWLQQQPSFDLALCLHEDWESHGFYLYELNPEGRPSFSHGIIDAVAQVCPIDPSPLIEGRDAIRGVINPDLDLETRPQWAESHYLIQNKTRQSYTLEAPSDFSLESRVAALVTAVRTVLESWGRSMVL